MSYVVYAMIDPRSQDIFYVGQSKNFDRRRKQHLRGTDQISGLIVQQMAENGFVPLFAILERCTSEDAALRAEIFWIELLTSRGAKLANAQADVTIQDRVERRTTETSKLASMRELRRLANGRRKPTKKTKAKQKTQLPTTASNTWSPRDAKRLAGMQKNGLDIKIMAKILGRSKTAIRDRLALTLHDD